MTRTIPLRPITFAPVPRFNSSEQHPRNSEPQRFAVRASEPVASSPFATHTSRGRFTAFPAIFGGVVSSFHDEAFTDA